MNGKALPNACLLLITAIYLTLAGWNAVSKRPGGDEVQFANPAIDLITRGTTGVTIFSGYGSHPEIAPIDAHGQTYSYWAMPLSFLSLAGWFKVVGVGFLQMRALPVLLGLIGLLSWYLIVRAITGSEPAALLAMGLISIDRAFLDAAADGRPDMQSAAFAAAAIAAYLLLRDRNLNRAVLVSQVLMAMSIFSHPIGGAALIALVSLAFCLDWRRFRWRHIPLAAAPYLVAAALWGWYISLDPWAFRMQFFGNASHRLGGLASPLKGFVDEIGVRFFDNMYAPSYAHGLRKITLAIPFVYAAGVLLPLLSPGFRQRRNWLILPCVAVLYYAAFSLLEGNKPAFYLVHITPLLASCVALCACYFWQFNPRTRVAIAGLLLFLSFVEISWVVGSCVKNNYRSSYLPVVAFLKPRVAPGSLIMGQGEFAFAFGFYNNLTDDATLGYYTHKRPDWIIVDEKAYRQSFIGFQRQVPAIWAHVDTLLTRDFQKVFSVPNYDVYSRR